MPSLGQEPICANGQASIVNGVIICTVTQEATPTCNDTSPETVFVYFSDPSTIAKSLESSGLPRCTKITNHNGSESAVINGDPKFININGPAEGRLELRRKITALDLPRERINMDMWAIQISSANSATLADTMSEVQQQIDATSDAMRETYNYFSRKSQNTKLDPIFRDYFRQVGFQSFFPKPLRLSTVTDPKLCPERATLESYPKCFIDPRSSLNLTEMLINLSFAEKPMDNYNAKALDMCNFLAGNPKFRLFNE